MYKAIKIAEKNKDKLNAFLCEAEGRAQARTLNAADLIGIAEDIEKKTALSYLNKQQMTGARVTYRRGLSLPSSYKYRPEYTSVTIERRASGWFLVDAKRLPGNNKQAEIYSLTVSPDQDEEIIRRVRTYAVSQ